MSKFITFMVGFLKLPAMLAILFGVIHAATTYPEVVLTVVILLICIVMGFEAVEGIRDENDAEIAANKIEADRLAKAYEDECRNYKGNEYE
mgnify:CR=1 FL=1